MIYQKELSYINDEWKLIDIMEISNDDDQFGTADTVDLLTNIYKLHLSDAEYFFIAGYNADDKLKSVYLISKGEWGGAELYKRETTIYILLSHCKRFRLFHNHPSNILSESADDKESMTLVEFMTNMFGLTFVDSIIIGYSGFYSIKSKCITEFY